MEEGLEHPRLVGLKPHGLVGHQHIIDDITREGHRRHHGYIFQGPKGVGKASTAFKLAEALFAEKSEAGLFGEVPSAPSDDDPDISLIRAGTHPDVMVIEGDPDKASGGISVDQIRKVIPFLSHTASRGGMRFVLIDAMDQMNVNGANALLKTLEEPPENTIMVIIHHGQIPLLPTIRSRTQLVKFAPLGFEDTRAVIKGQFPDAEQNWIDVAAVLSEGAPGVATLLAEAGAPDLYAETCTGFAEGRLTGLEMDALAAQWGAGGAKNATRRQLARQFFDRLLVKSAKFAAGACGDDGQPHMDIEDRAINQLSTHLSAFELSEIRQDLLAALYEAERVNLDAAPIIFSALEKLNKPA